MIKKSLIVIVLLTIMSLPLLGFQFGKNKVQVEKLEWSVISTMHFDIYYPKGRDDFGKTAALMSEEAYFYLQEAFQAPIRGRVPIILYESHREFQVTNIIYQLLTEGVGGFTESLHNRVVVPYHGSYKDLEEVLIHELTHAYVNALDRGFMPGRIFDFPRMQLPFWFSEGLPEYLAIGGEDNYNNMFLMDMVFNSYFQPLERVGGFFAYRVGESFLTYIDEHYGRDAVMRYFYATRASATMDAATQQVFGMNFEDLQKRWRNHLFRKFTPYLQTHEIPYEVYSQRTDHREDGSYLNFAPRFSPDGRRYLYFSNRGQRMSIWRAHAVDIFEPTRILKGETTGRFEQFHFLRKNISWFPDNQRFAFVAKTKAGDVIYIADANDGSVLEEIEMFDFDAIFEIDVCREGEKIVFSGQKMMNNNIYFLELETHEISQITDDRYYDHQPRWSPDGTKIVFASERDEMPEHRYEHIFNRLTDQIYYYDLNEEKFYQVTTDNFSNHSPMFNSTGTKILFISEEYDVSNFHVIDLETGERAKVTNTLNGVFNGDLNYDDSQLVFSVYYHNGWNIYLANRPLVDLDYGEYGLPEEVELIDDFFARFDLDRYRYYGRREERYTADDVIYRPQRRDRDLAGMPEGVDLSERPEEVREPEIEPYRTRFYLDRLWGGLAYSTTWGTVGSLQIGLSDVMGDNTISIQMGIAGELRDSDFIFTYLYLPHRLDIGFGAFYLTDETIYISYAPNPANDIFRSVWENETGIYNLFRYPFNRFWRVDLENHFFYRRVIVEDMIRQIGVWEEVDRRSDFVFSPRVSFVHDNIIWGPTGPMSGWRGRLSVNRSLSRNEHNFFTAYTDLRSYSLFAKRYSFATRLLLGASVGDNPQSFRLDGFERLRGLTEETRGHKIGLTSFELRFPFIDEFRMAFPLPITLTQLRGSIYTDIGAVWDVNREFRVFKDGKLDDVVLGFGFGPRLNLGYFVLKFDIAWSTDLDKTGPPSYFISISPDF